MKRFAFVDENGKCYTIVVSESKESLSVVPGGELGIELEDDSLVGPGWKFEDGNWIQPTPALEG